MSVSSAALLLLGLCPCVMFAACKGPQPDAPGAVGADTASPPTAEKHPKATTLHGQTRVDDYFWLRDKADPKVLDYLKAEDDYADLVMKPTAPLQEALFTEMIGHVKETDDTVPYRRGEYFYYSRTVEGQQYPIFCRKRGSLTAPEEVVLDQNELAKGENFMAIGAYEVSDDSQLLAFSTDNAGYRQYTLQVKDLRTGRLLPERIERVTSVAWAADNRTLYYVTEDPVTKRSDKLFRHVLGTTDSALVHDEADELFDIGVGRTRDRAMIVLAIASKTSSEARYVPANTPAAPLAVVVARQPEHEYDVDHRAGRFYIRTNKGATNFRVVTAPVGAASEANWTELVAHRPGIKIEAVDLFARHLVLQEWEDGLQQIEVLDLESGARDRLTFPEPVYAASLANNFVFDTGIVRYTYQSLVTPVSVFDYDLAARTTTLLKQTEVPGGFNRSNYAAERVFATAADGTKIPISLVYRKGVKRDGSAALLLNAYGSYGISVSPAFAASRLPLLDRGVVYAIAHVRGGGELGEPWREAGRMMKKMNTFTDFLASAEHLIAEKYTSSAKLIIQGGSAGGMLVGAVANLRPDLFKAVIAQVPFVDVLNTMLDPSLPLTTSEYIEWGNPQEKPAYDYMATYSPYDNVKAQAYPAMLVKVSVNDSQVPYWEGAKLVAKLRATKTDRQPLVLKVNFGAGHGGASGRYDRLREQAFDAAFALWQFGLGGQNESIRSSS